VAGAVSNEVILSKASKFFAMATETNRCKIVTAPTWPLLLKCTCLGEKICKDSSFHESTAAESCSIRARRFRATLLQHVPRGMGLEMVEMEIENLYGHWSLFKGLIRK